MKRFVTSALITALLVMVLGGCLFNSCPDMRGLWGMIITVAEHSMPPLGLLIAEQSERTFSGSLLFAMTENMGQVNGLLRSCKRFGETEIEMSFTEHEEDFIIEFVGTVRGDEMSGSCIWYEDTDEYPGHWLAERM